MKNITSFILLLALAACTTSGSSTIEDIRRNRPWIPLSTHLGSRMIGGKDTPVLVDRIDMEFSNDNALPGTWKAVDFVEEIDDFRPGRKSWQGSLMWNSITVLPEGETDVVYTWTSGYFIHSGDKTASAYQIVDTDDGAYMFKEHKSGDYIIRFSKPSYYVFKKQ